MKVLYLINGLGTGGAERSLAEMLPSLRECGVEVMVACLHPKPEGVSDHVTAAGFTVRYVEARHLAGRVRLVRELIRKEQPAVMHTTIIESDIIGRLAAVRTGVPVLTSLVSTPYVPARYADPNITPWKLRLMQQADSWTARHLTDHFHAITEAVRLASMRDLGIPAERIAVIPRGRGEGRIGGAGMERRRRVRCALRLPEEAEVLVNVGRQEYAKGQRHLLEAFKIIAGKRPNVLLLIAGRKGHASPELEHQMASSALLRDRVRFLGHVDDVPDLLATSDLFVFPSLYEGLGGAVIEAMALGLPIVASDLPAMREVTESGANAVLVPPADVPALTRAIGELLDDPDRRERYARRSRGIYEERFTLHSVVDRMAELYRSVAER